MGKTFRTDPIDVDAIRIAQRDERDARDAQRAADWNRDAKRFDAWTMDRASYDDEVSAFAARTVRN